MPSPARLKLQLSVFMFLQYAIWGAWFPSMGAYLSKTLGFNGAQIGAAYSAFAIGAMISPFFVGLIADRFFASEKLLAVLGLLGAGLLFATARLREFESFYPALIAYCASFVPTLALGNSLALTHLPDIKKSFPHVKILSAVGWIAGSVILSLLEGERSNLQFHLAGGISLLFAGFCLTLPYTPPQKTGQRFRLRDALGFDALSMLKRPSFAVFIVCIFLISIPLKAYFVMTAIYLTELQWTNVAGKMALAQVSDIVALFVMPVMLARLGYKKAILIGVCAWIVRFSLFALSAGSTMLQTPLIYTSILLHGVCYDFLYIAAQLYVNAEANDRNRAAAQGMIAFILWGISSLVGTLLAGKLLATYKLAEPSGTVTYQWQAAWMIPALIATGVMIIFALAFRSPAAAAPATARS
jgi:nucleoside transporter